MKSSMFTAVSLALITSGIALAQDRPQPASTKPDTPIARPAATKSLNVSGRVSSDGQSLVTDLDTEWTVSNAEVLKGREGSLVTVKCYVDSDRNQIRVLSVRSAQPEVKFASRQGDSAFRR
jgi:hypothetical protein